MVTYKYRNGYISKGNNSEREINESVEVFESGTVAVIREKFHNGNLQGMKNNKESVPFTTTKIPGPCCCTSFASVCHVDRARV